jgi:hypothetical protein
LTSQVNRSRVPADMVTEVFIRTAHILLKLEEAEKQMSNDNGKAIVFGTFRSAA